MEYTPSAAYRSSAVRARPKARSALDCCLFALSSFIRELPTILDVTINLHNFVSINEIYYETLDFIFF